MEDLVTALRAALVLAYGVEDSRVRAIVIRYIEDAILRLGSDL